MIVYHGSDVIVKYPDISHSYRPLDFGKGFYVTTNREQAVRWAKRKSDLTNKATAFVNEYELSSNDFGLKVKIFADDLYEWIDFVCNCRDGGTDYLYYDIIKGMVADDKVFRVVDMYHAGIWDKDRALLEIKAYPQYDQIAFISQEAINKKLTFKSAIEV